MAKGSKALVRSAALLDFDITVGDKLLLRYTTGGSLPCDDDELSALAIPEGGHNLIEDHTYILKKDPATGEQLYGLSYFHNRRDKTAKRGAIMKAMLLFSTRPFFSFYLNLLRQALLHHLDSGNMDVLKTLVVRVNDLYSNHSTTDTITLFESPIAVDMPTGMNAHHFAGASLLQLVSRFREDTMIIWWALLLRLRLLFCGQPAGDVGNCCLAAPLLVAPLQGFTPVITPYVPLSHPSAVMECPKGGTYICGTTNKLFATKEMWFDAACTFASGGVTLRPELRIKVAAREMRLIKSILSGIDRDGHGELWVREQFRQHTESVLLELQMGRLGPSMDSLKPLQETAQFRDFIASREAPYSTKPVDDDHASPQASYSALIAAADKSSERLKLLFTLQSSLENLSDIEALIEVGAVRRLSADDMLRAESASVRKYAVSCLAKLLTTLKGQVAFLVEGALPRIVSLLRDQMPAVSTAAASCIHKISGLYIGVQALLQADVHEALTSMLLQPPNDDLLLRSALASTLVQIYRFCPTAPRQAGAEASVAGLLEKSVGGRDLVLAMLQLLDAWEEAPPLSAAQWEALLAELPVVEQHMSKLTVDDLDDRTEWTGHLQSDLVSRRWLVIPLVMAGATEALNANSQMPEHSGLATISYSTLALLADCHAGVIAIVKGGLIPRALQALARPEPPYVFAACRFIEVLCQHALSAEKVQDADGVPALVKCVGRWATHPSASSLCLPALGALKLLLISRGVSTSERAELQSLATLAPASDAAVREALAMVLSLETGAVSASTTKRAGGSIDRAASKGTGLISSQL